MKPYAHQMTALEKSWNRETYAYFMEMGTGKTKVLIDNLAMLYDKGKVNGALIVAPIPVNLSANTFIVVAPCDDGVNVAV